MINDYQDKFKLFFPQCESEFSWWYAGTYLPRSNYPRINVVDGKSVPSLSTMREWCQTEFGDNWIWSFNTFYFLYDRDANWFALKWL